jgi:hypothetical protein
MSIFNEKPPYMSMPETTFVFKEWLKKLHKYLSTWRLSGTLTVTTSGTSVDFTGIPAGTRKITLMYQGVSTSGTSIPIIQLGDSGGIETAGYLGSGNVSTTPTTQTTGFGLTGATAAGSVFHGSSFLSLMDTATNLWVFSSVVGYSNAGGIGTGGGSKALTAELTQIRLTTVGGTDTFDAGSMNIMYEQ